VASNVIICVSSCSHTRCNRLPLPSCLGGHCLFARVAWHVTTALHDGVFASLHVAQGGHHAMARLLGFAHGTGVFGIEADAMCPAVKDDSASSGYICCVGDGHCSKHGMWRVVGGGIHFVVNGTGDGIGMPESSLCTGAYFNVVLILFFEMHLKVCHGVLGSWLVFPFVSGTAKDTCS